MTVVPDAVERNVTQTRPSLNDLMVYLGDPTPEPVCCATVVGDTYLSAQPAPLRQRGARVARTSLMSVMGRS